MAAPPLPMMAMCRPWSVVQVLQALGVDVFMLGFQG
jgi:hypothetical protein